MASLLFGKSYFAILRGDVSAGLTAAEALEAISRKHGIALFGGWAKLFAAWARGRLRDPAGGAVELRQALAVLADQGARIVAGFGLGLLAELEAEALGADRALASIDDALSIAHQIEQRNELVFLHRLRGEIMLKRNPPDLAAAEESFRTAIAIAKQQGERSCELLASLALAKLHQSTGRLAEAHALLAPVLEGFSPTPEMPEIAEAQALVAALAETEEVKAAEAQRERRLDLQTAYGHALMWGKSFAAEESSAAFARASEFAGPTDTGARFAAYYAQCQNSFVRGQLSSARETAETFLREAEAGGHDTEVGFALGMRGLILLNQGELKTARPVLERALRDCGSQRQEETGLRFWDAEVSVSAYLALVEWHLGEVERARELVNRAIRRAEQLGIFPVIVHALNWRAVLECQRQDVSATRNAAEAVLALAEEHEIKSVADFNWIYANWARGRLLDPEAGALGLKQALATFMDKGLRVGAPFFHGLLAELEAATQGPEAL
jgi:tetratricopeptide (TPR) repeat protein